ncbi:MAG: winged helix-turn-helix domain-containing protein [Candidatus Izemoplasmatales bacterium]
MKPLVFSVEDDINIQNVIKIAMQNSQFEIETFNNAKDLFSSLEHTTPDLLLLDIMLPDLDGLEIIKKLKKSLKTKNIPIMVISAKTSEIDKVIGIDLGADDYLVKPFGVLELVSRSKALLRRQKLDDNDEIVKIDELIINTATYEVFYKQNKVDFTKKQFQLLLYFAKRNNKIITREELLNNIWGFDFIGETRTLDVHIKELRRKLKLAGVSEEVIETSRGIGYKFSL